MKNISKSISIVCITAILFSTNVMAACDLQRFKFGTSYERVQKHFDTGLEKAPVSIQMLFVPGSDVCEGQKVFLGAPVIFTFLYNKLVQIEVNRLSKKSLLGAWAESVYGVKSNKPRSYFSSEPNAQWHWDKSAAVITYSIVTYGIERDEYIQIQSKRHEELFAKWAEEEESQ